MEPGATLQLFEIIHDQKGPRRPLPPRLECPHRGLRLLVTEDTQRATSFRYWRCAREHGRYITFFDFLREKDFVRELDARQLAELRSHVRSVNCSNCGAPIDLATSTACGYCHTPLAMLDLQQVGRVVDQLREAASRATEPRSGSDVPLALALLRERQQVDAFFSHLGTPDWSTLSQSGGLLENGPGAVVSLLRGLR